MRRRTGLLFVAPALALFGVFVLYPMVTAFSYAFYDWQGTARGGFAGLANFTTLFTRPPFITDLPRALAHSRGLGRRSWVHCDSACPSPRW